MNYGKTLADNQQITVSANPKTVEGHIPSVPGPAPFNFNVINPDSGLLTVSNINPSTASFDVSPNVRFFGEPRVVVLKIQALKMNQGALVSTDYTVTVTGTLPDDGTLDHFEPTETEPVPQAV